MDFSCLMATYKGDSPTFLKKSLESLYQQTIPASEIIIVKDGPLTQDLEDVISEFQRKLPIKSIQLAENLGLGLALKEGLKQCSFDLVARMDSDDICKKNRFERQIQYLEKNKDVSVLGTGVEEFNEEPGDLKQFRKLPIKYQQLKKIAKSRNPLNHPTVMFIKNDILEVGSYQDMKLFEDYFLWCRLIHSNKKIENLDEILVDFRIGNDMIGRRHGLSYARKELSFLKELYNIGFLNYFNFISQLIIKFPLRLLPKNILTLLYSKLLR